MSSFNNNNQILHIAAECAVIAAVTFYMSIKYKQIRAKLESLNNRIEEQSEIIQKHEAMINQLSMTLNKIINPQNARPKQMKSKIFQQIPEISEKSPPKTELPKRNKPVIEEISIEEELKSELEELKQKTKKDEKSDEGDGDGEIKHDLKTKKKDEKSDEA